MSISQIDMEEFRQDMLQQDYKDEQHEIQMRRDMEYALGHLIDTGDTHIRIDDLVTAMATYGHTLTITDVKEMTNEQLK